MVNKQMTATICICLCVVLSNAFATQRVITSAVSDSIEVVQDNPDLNYGSDTSLFGRTIRVYGGSPSRVRTYTRSDGLMTALAGYTAADVVSAKLMVFSTAVAQGEITHSLVQGAWDRNVMTWNTAVGWNDSIGSSFYIDNGIPEYQPIDVLPEVTAWLNGAANYGMVFKSNYWNQTMMVFSERATAGGNGGAAGTEPYFEITVMDPPHVDINANSVVADINQRLFGQVLPFKGVLEIVGPTSLRGPTISGNFYNWKTLEGVSPWFSSLDTLKASRDSGATVWFNVNTLGSYGVLPGTLTYPLTDPQIAALSDFAAKNVRYCNYIARTYRQGDVVPAGDQAILDSLSWGDKPKLLAAGEAMVPKITYWELGNEPEYEDPAVDYKKGYKAITAAMLAQDPSIKVGPSSGDKLTTPTHKVRSVLADMTCKVDFVTIHLYEALGQYFNNAANDDDDANIPVMETALCELDNSTAPHLYGQFGSFIDQVRSMLNSYGRTNVEIIVDEYEPTGWETVYGNSKNSMYNVLAVAQSLFVMMQKGVVGANHWYHADSPVIGGPTPARKLFEEFNANSGDKLVSVYKDDDAKIRLYTTKNSVSGRVTLWALNFNNSAVRPINISMSNISIPTGTRIIKKVLGNVNGTTDFFSGNSIGIVNIDWTSTDLTGQIDLNNINLSLPAASVTELIIGSPCDGTGTAYLQGDLNKDCAVNFKDFGMFAQDWLICNTPGVAGCIDTW